MNHLRGQGVQLLLALGLLAAGGCGLAEYESQMDQEQKRIAAQDEENKYLEPPVVLPAEKDVQPFCPPGEISFRPPKGIAFNKGEVIVSRLLYRFPAASPGSSSGTAGSSGSSVTGGATGASSSTSSLQAVYLGAAKAMKRSDFVDACTPGAPWLKLVVAKPLQNFGPLQPYGRPEIVFETGATDFGPSTYLVNFFKDPLGNYQVLIVFQVATPSQGASTLLQQPPFKYSLQSLKVGS